MSPKSLLIFLLKVIAAAAVFQAVLGFWQFIRQDGGVASVIIEGAKIYRAEGSLGHPNILAAFLLLGLCALIYLWPSDPKKQIIPAAGIFTILLGLTAAFSRTGWAIAALILIFLIIRREFRQAIAMAVAGILLFGIFYPYITARARISPKEPAVVLRAAYNKIGWEIIKARPFGIGVQNQVAYARENGLYQKFGLTEKWQEQPAHNIYILMAAEIGILGALALLGFIGWILFAGRSAPPAAIAMPGAMILFGFTDHFLWTTAFGQLMFWLTIGLAVGLNMADGKRS